MESAQSRYYWLVEKAAALLLLVYPTFMLAVKHGMNGVFFLMLILALAAWIVRPSGMSPVMWHREWTIYTLAMAAMTLAILISQTANHSNTVRFHDAATRYWLSVPVLLLLYRLRPKALTVLQLAFPVAAITGFLLAKDFGGRSGVATLDLIRFGNFELILGVMSLFSLNWFGRDALPLRMLKILGFIAGFFASLASGSRGGWLMIPVFIVIYIYFKVPKLSFRVILTTFLAASLVATLLYSANSTFRQRLDNFSQEVAMAKEATESNKGNLDTSFGVRLQLYKAALDVISRHPVFGVGPAGFALEMEPMMKAGKITPEAAGLGRGEVHNDILYKTAGMGMFGLIALLGIYFVPLRLFWRATKSACKQAQRAGQLGVTFVSGIIVYGLTAECLNLTMTTAFYSFTVAALLAVCYNVHYGEPLAK